MTASAAGAYFAPPEWKLKTMAEGTILSYGQAGEDLVAWQLLKYLGVERPSYLDVGAFHPTIGSNTYLMYRLGGRGVLVEPNVAMIKALKGVRPEDTTLNIGIGLDDTPEADYYVMNYPQMNTFDGDEARRREKDSGGKTVIQQVVKMPLGEHCPAVSRLAFLELQSAFARGIGEGLHAAMEEEAAAVEHDREATPAFLARSATALPTAAARSRVAPVLALRSLSRLDADASVLARGVIDDLRIDVAARTMDRQARLARPREREARCGRGAGGDGKRDKWAMTISSCLLCGRCTRRDT